MILISFSRDYVERRVEEVLRNCRNGLTFEELRNILEVEGIYIDGVELRGIVARMVRKGVVCKEISSSRRKLLLKLCG